MNKIKAAVLRVEYVVPSGHCRIVNIPLYPWDDLKKIKQQVKKAIPQGFKINTMRKTTALIQNPLMA